MKGSGQEGFPQKFLAGARQPIALSLYPTAPNWSSPPPRSNPQGQLHSQHSGFCAISSGVLEDFPQAGPEASEDTEG